MSAFDSPQVGPEYAASAACRGHRAAVVCLEARAESVFASGSEDQTVRVWDVRSSPQRAMSCLCECFPSSVDSLAFSPKNEHLLYASSGSQVFVFDLRASGVLQKVPLGVINMHGGDAAASAASAENEINALKIHPKGEHMAVGDDEGNVYVLELEASRADPTCWRVLKRLSRGVHTSIVGAVAFKPNSPRELVSGGFDCLACSWNFAMGRPQHRYNFGTSTDTVVTVSADCGVGAPANSPSQMFNPPCVHALGFACGGRVLLASLGDGTLRALHASNMTPLLAVEAHNAMASCLAVLPAAVVKGKSKAGASADEVADVAITSGVDGFVKGWRIGEGSATPTTGAAGGGGGGGGSSGGGEVQITPLFSIEHGRKVNAVAGFRGIGRLQPAHVLVAGLSGEITVYTPMQ